MISLKSKYEIEQMISAGRIVGEVLNLMGEKVRPGITTKELDKIAEQTGRTRNEIIQMCLEFAVENLEIKEDD